MKKFDRILNIVLGVAVVLFIVDYFLQSPPATFDEDKKSGFAPVELNRATPSADAAPVVAATAVGGPEVAAAEAFHPLSWEQMDARVNDSNGKPTLIVLFTSWCPHCKKMMPVVSELLNERKDDMNVLAISIDEDPAAIKSYVATHTPALPFPVYLHSTDNERALVQTYLYKNQLNFTGGVPYMAFFHEGKPVQQFGGFVEKKILADTLDRIAPPKNAQSAGS